MYLQHPMLAAHGTQNPYLQAIPARLFVPYSKYGQTVHAIFSLCGKGLETILNKCHAQLCFAAYLLPLSIHLMVSCNMYKHCGACNLVP